MSAVPQSNLSRPHPTDSRLLQNLIKGEKAYIENLAATSASAHAAASALAAWGTLEAPDIATAAQSLSETLGIVADAQRTHVQAMEGYRSALKDVLDREQSIRSVVRDRDILVGRLIKASKKKLSKKDPMLSQDDKNEKMMAAQRELHACEQVLASEEAALVGVKRRTFKEALTMRMKTMGDAGAAMVDAAQDAILLLDDFNTHGPLHQANGAGHDEDMYANDSLDFSRQDLGLYGGAQLTDERIVGSTPDHVAMGLVPDGYGGFHKHLHDNRPIDPRLSQQFEMASVTPSQSASQVANHDRAGVPLGQRYSSQVDHPVAEQHGGTPSDTDSEEDYRRAFIEPRINLPAPHELGVAADTNDSFIPQSSGTISRTNKKAANHTWSRSDGAQQFQPPPPPKKDSLPSVPMPPVPSAARLDVFQARNFGAIPTAPPAVTKRDDDSSDDDDDQQGQLRRHSSVWAPRPTRTGFSGAKSHPNLAVRSEADSSEGGAVANTKSKDSLFGKVSKLFKTDIGSPTASDRQGWETRTSARLQNQDVHRKRMSLRRNDPDSSDEEPDPQQLIRHVNNPKPLWARDSNNDIGVNGKLALSPRITAGPQSSKSKREEESRMEAIRASVMGNGTNPKSSQSIHSTGTKKKTKKKKIHSPGSEVGTAPTRQAPRASAAGTVGTLNVAGDLSSIQRSASVRSVATKGTLTSTTAGKKKKRSSMMSAGIITSSGGDNSNVFTNQEGKFSTASWVARPVSQMTAAEVAAMAGVVPKPSAPAPGPATPKVSPLTSLANKNPPPSLKPALKNGSLSRSASVTSAINAPSPRKSSTPARAKSALKKDSPLPPAESKASKTAEPSIGKTQPRPVASQPAPTSKATTTPLPPPPPPISNPAAFKLGKDSNIDGSGRLDGLADSAIDHEGCFGTLSPLEADLAHNPEDVRALFTPRLEMPSSEPFRIDLEGLSQGTIKRKASEDRLMTPSAEETYKAYFQDSANHESPSDVSNLYKANQPPGVTRLTDRKIKLNPSRVYGAGAPDVSSDSSDDNLPTHDSHMSPAIEQQLPQGAQVQASPAAAIPLQKGLQTLTIPPSAKNGTAASPTPSPATVKSPVVFALGKGNLGPAPHSDTSGSGVGRRKSVRMAPDVKLPPDTPSSGEFSPPKAHGHRHKSNSSSPAIGRIAPPPPAAAKTQKPQGPVDLAGASRERAGWSTRIRSEGLDEDSSSDEEDHDTGDYELARKAFRFASRDLGEAMGTVKPKLKKNATNPASVRSKASVKSKKPSVSAVFEDGTTGAAISSPARPTSTLYSVTAPLPTTSTLFSVSAPAPTTTSTLAAASPSDEPVRPVSTSYSSTTLPTNRKQPTMPPVPQAPPVPGSSSMILPIAPPPAIASTGGKGFFSKFKRSK